jgi:hypothetical protein
LVARERFELSSAGPKPAIHGGYKLNSQINPIGIKNWVNPSGPAIQKRNIVLIRKTKGVRKLIKSVSRLLMYEKTN